ncbi:DUF2905 family protein [Heyndrickxia sporothermodurans]
MNLPGDIPFSRAVFLSFIDPFTTSILASIFLAAF